MRSRKIEINVKVIVPKNSKDKVKYVLLDDLEFFGYTIPAGFCTDGATVPRLFWALLPPVHEYFPSAILHDYLLYIGKTSKDTDRIFRDSMIEFGVNKYRAKIMYFAVRAAAPFLGR